MVLEVGMVLVLTTVLEVVVVLAVLVAMPLQRLVAQVVLVTM
jgi:hypothetical protein